MAGLTGYYGVIILAGLLFLQNLTYKHYYTIVITLIEVGPQLRLLQRRLHACSRARARIRHSCGLTLGPA